VDPKQQIRRLSSRIAVLERRNLELRSEVERLTHGAPPPWTPFQQANAATFGDGRDVPPEFVPNVYVNSRFQVTVWQNELPGDAENAPLDAKAYHLSIRRQDGAAVHDWRDFQRIKNELCGDEAEAIELYPAESRLVDGANQYHLYVLVGARWPIGFRDRLVAEDSTDGVQQRPWPDDQRPDDLQRITAKQMAQHAGLEDA
jgi:hypothetical protein